MTSQERILATLNHQEPDRVPVDLSGHRSAGIMAMAYARLRDFLGLPKKSIRVYDPIQQLAIVDEDVLERFQVDTIELGRAFALEDKWWSEWTLPDGTPCLMPAWARPHRASGEWQLRSQTGRVLGRMPDGVIYFEQTHFPLMENDDPAQVAAAFDDCMWTAFATPPGPSVAGPDGERLLAETARRFRQQTDRAILGLFGGNLLLAGEPERAHRFLDRLVEIHLTQLDRFLAAVGDHVDVILFGDDFGMQQGPQISQAMYREFFQPRQRIMWQRVHERSRAKVMLHCCGGVRELLDDMIDAGLERRL
jgi:uroporphyrinogen decarboxylase